MVDIKVGNEESEWEKDKSRTEIQEVLGEMLGQLM